MSTSEISSVKSQNKPSKCKRQPQLSTNSNSSGSGTDLLLDHSTNENQSFSLSNRIDFSSKLIENNCDLILNCVQLINFIEFYFNDAATTPSTTPILTQNDSNKATNRSIHACFPCIVCSMQFSFDQTFHMHLERRSVIIRVYCIKCDSLKKFYNKCKLLYHVYSHKMTLFDPIYKSIQIESLSSVTEPASSLQRSTTTTTSVQMLSKERNIDIDLIFSNVYQFAAASNTSNTSNDYTALNPFNNGFKLCDNDLVQIQMFLKRLVINSFLVYKCHVCDAIFFHLKDLKQHYTTSQQLEFSSFENAPTSSSNHMNRSYFQNLKKKQIILLNNNKKNFKNLYTGYLNNEEKSKIDLFVSSINSFSFKKLQFSNRCFALASQNLLNNDEANLSSSSSWLRNTFEENLLICPECGLSFDGKTQSDIFKIHLVYECLFTIKYAPYQIKCPAHACNFLFENLDDAIAHWSSIHVLKQHQCDLCDRKGKWHDFAIMLKRIKFIKRECISFLT